MARKLTTKAVEALKPNQRIWDDIVRGFWVERRAAAISFRFTYRIHGKQAIYTIGRYGDGERTHKLGLPCTVEGARREAEWCRSEVAQNRDPRESAPRTTEGEKIGDVAEEYMARRVRARGLRTSDDRDAVLKNHILPKWRHRSLRSITRADVVALLDSIADAGTPGAARNTHLVLSTLFKFAIQRGLIDQSPVFGVPVPYTAQRKDRVLNDAEIAILWQASLAIPYPFGHFARLALALGQRRSEVASMRRADLDEAAKLWTIPSELNKAGRVQVVPLPALAQEIIAEATAAWRASVVDEKGEPVKDTPLPPHVFTTTGNTPISGFSKAKQAIDREIAVLIEKHKAEGLDTLRLFVEPWTFHDLRRTAATGMASLGVPRFVVARVLNHADTAVTGIYDRYAYLAEKRDALERWAAHLEKITALASASTTQRANEPQAA